MNSAAGFGNGPFSANQRGSVCPCGEMIGRSFTDSYSFTATARAPDSAGNNRFTFNIQPPLYSVHNAVHKKLCYRSLSNWTDLEQNLLITGKKDRGAPKDAPICPAVSFRGCSSACQPSTCCWSPS